MPEQRTRVSPRSGLHQARMPAGIRVFISACHQHNLEAQGAGKACRRPKIFRPGSASTVWYLYTCYQPERILGLRYQAVGRGGVYHRSDCSGDACRVRTSNSRLEIHDRRLIDFSHTRRQQQFADNLFGAYRSGDMRNLTGKYLKDDSLIPVRPLQVSLSISMSTRCFTSKTNVYSWQTGATLEEQNLSILLMAGVVGLRVREARS